MIISHKKYSTNDRRLFDSRIAAGREAVDIALAPVHRDKTKTQKSTFS
jgi:hypothetical protein